MPRNSGGTASRVSPPGSGGYVSGDTISPSIVNSEINDIYTELTNSIDKGGRTTPSANLPMGGKRHTGCGDAVDPTDYATYGQALAVGTALIPAGTKMPFYQASPPAGWASTLVTNDSMMRVVTAGTTGGTAGAGAGHSPILNNVVASHTHTFSDTTASGGAHSHFIGGNKSNADGTSNGASVEVGTNTYETTTASAHTHTFSGTTAVNASAASWQPRYMDFCVGTKS